MKVPYQRKPLFALCVLLCVVILYEIFVPCNTTKIIQSLNKKLSCWKNDVDYKDVRIIGIDRKKMRKDSKAKYILLLPRADDCSSCSITTGPLLAHLKDLLSSLNDFDGASCYGDSHRHKSCRFYTKHWSMVINNDTGSLITTAVNNKRFQFYNCNIVEGPVLLRREVFDKLELRPSHGEATMLDFFLRSNGKLKIAYSVNCAFDEKHLIANRGAMASKDIYLDFGLLGYHHGLLRIIHVHDDNIIWTQCTRTGDRSLCPNKPLQDIRTSNKLSHYCCNVALNKYLIDAVNGLEQAGIDYRLYGGTALGAVRTKNIIPWTRDIDITVKSADYRNSHAFIKLHQVMQKMQYSTPLVFQLRRILPQFPLTTHIHNLSSYDLFNKETLRQMGEIMPFEQPPDWGSLGYVDIYPYEDHSTFEKPSNVTINGKQYKTFSNPKLYLVKVFGESWKEVDYRFKSKDPHKLWVWKFDTSLKQEDSPTSSYCSFYAFIVLSLNIIVMYGFCRVLLSRKRFKRKYIFC